MSCSRKRKVKDDSKIFSLSIWKKVLLFIKIGWTRKNWFGENSEFSFSHVLDFLSEF